jgi:thioredoxin 1
MKLFVTLLLPLLGSVDSFSIAPHHTVCRTTQSRNNDRLAKTTLHYAGPDVSSMKLRDVKAELKEMGVSYSDCFDRESLLCRLQDAREGKVETKKSSATAASTDEAAKEAPATETKEVSTSANTTTTDLDAESVLTDLRSQPLKELKIQCSQRNMRYATFLEKEDFVQAIWKDMQKVARFSVSGALRPGHASEISGDDLDLELSSHETPILLDVHATWCGPCKMMAPELQKVAEELGSKCRVAKLDSDKYPQWAGRYKVQGLPTTLLIHKGKVQNRIEGAVMKNNLLEMVAPHI